MKKFDEKTYALALRIVRFNRSHGKIGDKDHILLTAFECGYDVWYHDYPAPILETPRGPLDVAIDAIEASQKRRPTPLAVRREEKERREKALYWNETRYRAPYAMRYTAAQSAAIRLWSLKYHAKDKAGTIAHYAENYVDAFRNMKAEATARMNYPEQVIFELNFDKPDLFLKNLSL